MEARIAPVPFEEWPPEVTGGIPGIEGSKQPASPGRRAADQRGRNALGVLAHHPGLARSWMQLTAQILRKSTLSERQRELLILRVAAVRKSQYQWVEHVPIARRCGLDDGDIARIAFGPDAPFWSPTDQALLRAADELLSERDVSDPTWSSLAGELSPSQLLDLLFTVSAYDTNCLMVRAFRIRPDASIRKEPHE
ncbi:MAG TPA: carboxymuconolactone decarboxylase family protein [Acidimicrobiales bacterium]|nr:carboxymuconolactone decarboxylase family protein [Acidimicrobiales bacterium]